MTLLTATALEPQQRLHIFGVAGHLHEYLQLQGEAAATRLIHEAERWTPGDVALDWESVVSNALTWGVQRGDFRRTKNGARILPPWALGPYERTDRALGDVWSARLHGAFPHTLFSGRVARRDESVFGADGVGVGRVTLAIAKRQSELSEALSAAGIQLRQWPAARAILLTRTDDLAPANPIDGSNRLQFMKLRPQFGRYAWTAAPRPAPVRGVARLLSQRTAGRNRYFITDRGECGWEISGGEVVTQAWRFHLLRSSGVVISPNSVVRITPTGVTFPSRTVPPLLVECLRPLDEGPDLRQFPTTFVVPTSIQGAAVRLVDEFLWRLSHA